MISKILRGPTIKSVYTVVAAIVIACSAPKGDAPMLTEDTTSLPEVNGYPANTVMKANDSHDGGANANDNSAEPEHLADDCIFDTSTQTDEFVRRVEEFTNYTWDDESKTATILLQNGDTLYAQRGGCYHFTYSVRLVTRENTNVLDTAFWLSKGTWLAGKLFKENDRELLDRILKERSYETYSRDGELFIDLQGEHNYSEFYLLVRPKGEWVETELTFYFDYILESQVTGTPSYTLKHL